MSIRKNDNDVYIELKDRPFIKLKSSPSSEGSGTSISNGTVVKIVQPTTIDNNHVLVSVNGQTGWHEMCLMVFQS